jgi:hypothetical protein
MVEPKNRGSAVIERNQFGVTVDGRFFAWDLLGAVPKEEARRLRGERDQLREKARKLERERSEEEPARRLSTPADRTVSRWMFVRGCWSWHEWSDGIGWYVDTGITPVPGKPLAQQRPPGR